MFFEAEGFSRTAGRIFGRLLLSDAPLSLDQLAADLEASKASISTETRLLERRGALERVGRRGDRRAYYQVAPKPTGSPTGRPQILITIPRRYSSSSTPYQNSTTSTANPSEPASGVGHEPNSVR